MFIKFLVWLVESSKDPSKLSLTLKAGIPFILIFIAWANLGDKIDAAIVNQFIEMIVNVIAIIAQLVTALIALYGFGRKIYLTYKGA